MKSLNSFTDKSVALLVWNTEVENDAHIYLGKIETEGEGFLFVNEEKHWRVTLDDEKLEKLQPVTEEFKEMFLDADWVLSLSMAGLPDDPGEEFKQTGMKWH